MILILGRDLSFLRHMACKSCGVSLDGPLCAVQTWVSTFIYLSISLATTRIFVFVS